jgi:tetratricopeptide (TPR) repeat protein
MSTIDRPHGDTRNDVAYEYLKEAQAFFRNGDQQHAFESFVKASRSDATIPDVWINIGSALASSKKHRLAALAFRKALELDDGGTATTYLLLANALMACGDVDQAEGFYIIACRLDPKLSKAHYGLAYLYMMTGRLQEANASVIEALTIDPDVADIIYLRGCLNLCRKKWTSGFVDYDARLVIRRASYMKPDIPMWDGEDLTHKRLQLFCEQGFGDIIQFLRFVRYLPMGVYNIDFMVPKEMRRLIEDNFKDDRRITFYNAGVEMPKPDYCYPLCGIPRQMLKTMSEDEFPVHGRPYINHVNTIPRIEHARGTKMSVGVVWAGDPQHQNDASRSTSPEVFVEGLARPGIELYSLQVGSQAVDPALLGELGVMQNMAPLIKDFADTAAIIAQLDCVVSVDTAVAHLAGAMGVPCHLLIPYAAVDWRWGHGSTTTPWYESIILHRQQQGESWRSVLQNVGDSF